MLRKSKADCLQMQAVQKDNLLKRPAKRITKVELYNLDGSTSEVKLTFPYFTSWLEPQEITVVYLSEMVFDWTRHWIKISGFKIYLGTVDINGNESYGIEYPIQEIPLGKVFHNGVWKDPFEYSEAKNSIVNPKSKAI